MVKYTITISKSAQKELDKLPDAIAENLLEAILGLANDPRPPGCKELKGYEAYRIRTGNYRIIYEIKDNVLSVEVITIGHRKDVYN